MEGKNFFLNLQLEENQKASKIVLKFHFSAKSNRQAAEIEKSVLSKSSNMMQAQIST